LRSGMKSGDTLCICRNCPVVHDIPITLEVEAEMRASPTLSEWLAEPGRAREAGVSVPADVLADMRGTPSLAEADLLRRHAHDLEQERPHLTGHIANLEAERPHLTGHIANLEGERPRLLEHIANLERELTEARTRLANGGLMRRWRARKHAP
jgi:hypothetical protein